MVIPGFPNTTHTHAFLASDMASVRSGRKGSDGRLERMENTKEQLKTYSKVIGFRDGKVIIMEKAVGGYAG